MSSLWLDEPAAALRPRRLGGAADAIVVGGGVTGCACALTLARGGLRVRLCEARTIASGASGRNGGFALRGLAGPYDEARTRVGRKEAAELWWRTERALDEIESLAGDAFCRTGSVRLAADPAERDELRAEYEALREDGFAAEWADDLQRPVAGRFHGAIVHPPDGALQPARWVRRLAALASDAGAELREGTRVESLVGLDAEHVVIATDGYTRGLVPELDAAVTPTRGQVVATEPLREVVFPRPHYARHGYDYWQQTPDRRLVVGGWRDSSFATEETLVEETTPLIQGKIEAFLRDVLGETPPITHRWAGIFGVTADRLPLVGPLPAEVAGRDGVWACCGYSGHGNVLGFLCGQLVARAILGEPADALRLFDLARVLDLRPS